MISNLGLRLIKHFEGCKLQAYQDSVGVWTIGYGHTENVIEGLSWTQQQADEVLAEEVESFYDKVKALVKVKLDDNQMAALTSFAYNLGLGNLKKSTLLVCVNKLNQDPSAEFLKWNKARGKVLAGLTKRRQAEADLYMGNLDAVEKALNS